MSIIYIISLTILFVSFLYLKKSEKKLDLISWIAINIVLLLCYNTFICYVYTTINIPINLISLSIINYILSVIFIILLKKKRQRYKFDKKDIIVVVILLFVTILFSYINFRHPLQIKYVMTDAGVHYNATTNFLKSEKLLIKSGSEMMPGAYSNAGILMKVFSQYMEFVDLYKVFICFDIFMFFVTGFLMYVALKKFIKSKYETIISTITSIIYMIGYPLNALLFGYFYLQLGIIIFSTIIIVMEYFKDETLNLKYLSIILFLLCLELFFSYYLFVPVVYGSLFIYYLITFYKKESKLLNKDFIMFILVTLIIPFISGFIYNILPGIKSVTEVKAVQQIGLEGYIYRNIYSNIILFIPAAIVYIWENRKRNFNVVLLIVLVIFMITLYIGTLFKVVSTYYFYKTYFILWFLMIYLYAQGILYIFNKNNSGKILALSYILLYTTILFISLFTVNVKVTKETTTDESILDVMEIYGLNKTILTEWEVDFTLEEIEILKFVQNEIKIEEDTEILIFGDPKQEYWFWGIFNYRNRENPEVLIATEDIEKWNKNEKFDYLIYFNKSMYTEYYKDIIDLDKEVLYSNKSGSVIKNN